MQSVLFCWSFNSEIYIMHVDNSIATRIECENALPKMRSNMHCCINFRDENLNLVAVRHISLHTGISNILGFFTNIGTTFCYWAFLHHYDFKYRFRRRDIVYACWSKYCAYTMCTNWYMPAVLYIRKPRPCKFKRGKFFIIRACKYKNYCDLLFFIDKRRELHAAKSQTQNRDDVVYAINGYNKIIEDTRRSIYNER